MYQTHPRMPWTNWDDTLNMLKWQGFYPKTLVDVGVATDTMDLYKHFPLAKFLFIEPLAEFKPHLEELCQKFNGSYLLGAASPVEGGTLDIMVTPDLGGSSQFETVDAKDGAYVMTARTVPTYRLDAAWDRLQLQGPALLKIDVQGGELEVLKGAEGCLQNFEVVMMEVGLIEQYVGQPILHEYIAYMAERGFVVYDIMHMNYAQTKMLAQLDVLFVKKDSKFRKDQRWFTDYSEVPKHDNYKGVKPGDNIVNIN